MRFVDTNIFIRYLTQDHPARGPAALALFQRVRAGTEALTTCETIIAEVVYVLSSRGAGYGLSPADIRARFLPVLRLRGLKLPQKRTVLRALDLYAQHPTLDFEDLLAIAHMERLGIRDLVSYDLDFDRVPGISRHEP
jgi:predicted nucleic acid-binding protein